MCLREVRLRRIVRETRRCSSGEEKTSLKRTPKVFSDTTKKIILVRAFVFLHLCHSSSRHNANTESLRLMERRAFGFSRIKNRRTREDRAWRGKQCSTITFGVYFVPAREGGRNIIIQYRSHFRTNVCAFNPRTSKRETKTPGSNAQKLLQ